MPDTEQREAPAAATRRRRVRDVTLRGDRPLLAMFLAALAIAVVVVSGPVQTWLDQRDRVERLDVTLQALQEENEALGERAEQLKDPDHVEFAAREEQGMVRPGEEAYVVVPPHVEEPVIGAEPPDQQDERSPARRVWDAVAGLFGD